MTRFVLDCSVTMAWCFEDEANAYADAVQQALSEHEVVAPGLWPLEVANVLLVAERRGRLNQADSARFLSLLETLGVVVDDETPQRAWTQTIALAREQSLSAYDAAYIELALRQGLPIATLDAGLKKAARKLGVILFKG